MVVVVFVDWTLMAIRGLINSTRMTVRDCLNFMVDCWWSMNSMSCTLCTVRYSVHRVPQICGHYDIVKQAFLESRDSTAKS